MGRRVANPPRIFTVNWFRKDASGRFVWPGFGENMRVLQWIVGRCKGTANAVETPLGFAPAYGDVEWSGLEFGPDRFEAVSGVDRGEWARELASHDDFYARMGTDQPAQLINERRALADRLGL